MGIHGTGKDGWMTIHGRGGICRNGGRQTSEELWWTDKQEFIEWVGRQTDEHLWNSVEEEKKGQASAEREEKRLFIHRMGGKQMDEHLWNHVRWMDGLACRMWGWMNIHVTGEDMQTDISGMGGERMGRQASAGRWERGRADGHQRNGGKGTIRWTSAEQGEGDDQMDISGTWGRVRADGHQQNGEESGPGVRGWADRYQRNGGGDTGKGTSAERGGVEDGQTDVSRMLGRADGHQ